MSGRVFIVQRPAYYDRARRGWVNKYDLTSAEEHGTLIFLLPPGNIYQNKLKETLESLHRQLSDYDQDDYILAVGDPLAIAMAVMVAARSTDGIINLLRFDRMGAKYDAYRIDASSNDG